MAFVLFDSGPFLGLFYRRDSHHQNALRLADNLGVGHDLVVAWPVLYEVANTRLARQMEAFAALEAFLKRPNVHLVDDFPYRASALDEAFEQVLRKRPSRALSLVDCILRLILEDRGVAVDVFLTFNVGDFADICRQRQIELVSG